MSALLALTTAACVSGSASGNNTTTPNQPSYYYVLSETKNGSSTSYTGASVQLSQEAPKVPSFRGHSLAELFVSNGRGDAIGIGWSEDVYAFNSNGPHLLIERFSSKDSTTENAMCVPPRSQCGLIESSGGNIKPTAPLNPGEIGTFGINHDKRGWGVYYDHQLIGRFPQDIFGGSFTSAAFVVAQGEVATFGKPCGDEMGNGKFGDKPGAASMSNFRLLTGAASVEASLDLTKVTDASYYSGMLENNVLYYGGPGATDCPG